jgi:hypothetical protein
MQVGVEEDLLLEVQGDQAVVVPEVQGTVMLHQLQPIPVVVVAEVVAQEVMVATGDPVLLYCVFHLFIRQLLPLV